jgi:hypothetical protein
MDDNQLAFDKAYWAAHPPEVRALQSIDDFEQRTARGADLATKGFTIDVPIMLWGWDPYLVMKLRTDFGYTWVPSALQPAVTIAPGLSAPGAIPYDPTHPPPGAIHVSINIGDFPPFDPPNPTPPPVAATNDPVGLQSLGTLYFSVRGEAFPDGAKFTDPRGTFLKHVILTPFGPANYWEKVA